MTDPLSAKLDDAHDLQRRLEHDLCGPLITARGFLDEVVELRGELGQWMEANREPLSELGGGAMEKLLEEELDVCVSYLEQALSQLDERVITLSTTLMSARASNEPE